ncbi:hypothetical protein PG985_005113 [Apiospora marii]|uniref:uncharacterized protein n=1 Tax=Apiospora marii TaxID=335849 RepID=UPI00312FCB7A
MAPFQFKPNAVAFVPRGMPTMVQTLATPATPTTNGSSNEMPCQAILQYHTCLCRKQVPIWACSRPQSQCTHQNISLVVMSLPYACCAETDVGARGVNKKQRPSSQGAEESCRTEACRAADPANRQYVSDADAAPALQKQELVKLDAFPGLSAKHLDEVAPAFVEGGKSWPDEVRARYQALRASLGVEDEEEEKAATATASSPTMSDNNDQSDWDDDDETGKNSDSDTESEAGANSDDDDDEPPATSKDPAKAKLWAAMFGSIRRPDSSTVIDTTGSYESDIDSDYESDDEEDDDDETDGKKKKKNKYSLRSLVEESEPILLSDSE